MDEVFAALGDPTRRHLLDRLGREGPLSATQLAGQLPISRQAVVKHLGSLSAAGLLSSDRQGRHVLYGLQPGPLGAAGQWLEDVGRRWDNRLVALVKHLSDEDGDRTS